MKYVKKVESLNPKWGINNSQFKLEKICSTFVYWFICLLVVVVVVVLKINKCTCWCDDGRWWIHFFILKNLFITLLCWYLEIVVIVFSTLKSYHWYYTVQHRVINITGQNNTCQNAKVNKKKEEDCDVEQIF